MALVDDEMRLIPSAKLFNNPCYQKLQEKWCASQFGIGYGKYINKCKIGVNDTSHDIDADFFLQVDNVVYPFQITEAQKEGRKRGREFKDIESGTTFTFPYRPAEGSIQGVQWIVSAIKKKANKCYSDANKLNLLVYANFTAPDLEYLEIIKASKAFSKVFYSIWITTNSNICSLFSKPTIGQLKDWHRIM